MNLLIVITALVALLGAGCGSSYSATVLYVSPDASGDGTGSETAPFATLEQARDAIRAMKAAGDLPEGGVVVQLQAGVYERDAAFELTADDSGTQDAPIVYRAAPEAEVRIVGGKVVTGFQPVTDGAVLAKLEPGARGKVLQADLRAQGVTDFGKMTQRGFAEPIYEAHMELFFQDKPMTLARWPNGEYSTMVGLPEGEDAAIFNYDGDRPARWVDEPDAWVYGYWYHDWADNYMEVKAIDPGANTIETVNKHRYGLRKGNRWFALNLLPELDSPGEYYVDREKGILYFWPPAPLSQGKAMVSVASSLISMSETSYVTIRGMILEACRGTAVTIGGADHDQVVACTIRNTGNRAVNMSGADHAVIGCDIYETGDGGIGLIGGDRATLTPARVRAENNHIHHFSRWCHTYRPAVGVSGCGNIVRSNLMHHGSHNAIQLGGNDHLIEFNEVHSVCQDTGDVGAFYMGRDWTARGTVIRHNYWHAIRGPGRIGAMGVYLDDQASGIYIYGNLFYDVTRAAFIGGGCDNIVENNVFVNCNPSVHIDARGLGWQKAFTDDTNSSIHQLLRSLPYQNELWTRRFPNLPNILNDDPGTPKRNRVVRNISVGGQWESIDGPTRQYQVIEDNLVDQDPHFVDAENMDFRLKEDSPAFALGFKPIPIERMGLYESDDRASWPVVHEADKLVKIEPGPAPRPPNPATTPPPIHVAPKTAAAIKVDGDIGAAEWPTGDPKQTLILKEDFGGYETKRISKAWVQHDGERLLVAVDNIIAPPLRDGHEWGRDDAVEIAIQNTSAGDDQDILVLRGYADGTTGVEDKTGAPSAVIARSRQGVEFAAKVIAENRWAAEWAIPFASLGIDPATHRQFAFNIAVRKPTDDLWLMWRSTRSNTWYVDRAGILKLGE